MLQIINNNEPVRILIADDDYVSLEILSKSIRNWGFHCDGVSDGKAAYDFIKSNSIDIALLDWMMPEINGIDLCDLIRKLPDSRYIYIILLTGRDRTEDRIVGLDAGADDYITKPFSAEELRARLSTGKRIVELQKNLLAEKYKVKRYASEMEQIATERAQQLMHADRMATLGLLSAGIAHEINNPTTFISGNIQFLDKIHPLLSTYFTTNNIDLSSLPSQLEFLIDELPKVIKSIRSGTERINLIVNNLRLFSGSKPVLTDSVNINDCIDQALLLCQNRLKYNIRIIKNYCKDLPLTHGSIQQMEQVIINLLINSADAMLDSEMATIEITTSFDHSAIIIKFSDNGPGIPIDIIDKIWLPFFTTKSEGKGTGLGLFICKEIIDQLNGSISCSNMPSSGALFTISIPAGEHSNAINP
jgi:C4-dicarboxylate-specific signal transduction histidine kinase